MSRPAAGIGAAAGVLMVAGALLPAPAWGVPIIDGKSIVQHGFEITQMTTLTGERKLEADKKRRLAELHRERLEALDAALALMSGASPGLADLATLPGGIADIDPRHGTTGERLSPSGTTPSTGRTGAASISSRMPRTRSST